MRVADHHAGKRGKCPRCGRVFLVPRPSAVATVACANCRSRIRVSESYPGKRIICPNCRTAFVVPGREIVEPSDDRAARNPDPPHAASPDKLTLVDVPDEYKISRRPPAFPDTLKQTLDPNPQHEEEPSKDAEPVGQRKLPWLIDVFLYPTSTPGLIHIAVFAGVPMLIGILLRLLGPFAMALGLPAWIVRILIYLYMYWYLAECVRDSAKGGTRAPEAFAFQGMGEMYSQALHILGCWVVFCVPAFLYFVYTQRQDAVFWALVAYGVFFFPMGLLACVMFDSVRGLNPIILIPSIFSTFLAYCALVLLVAVIVLVSVLAGTLSPSEEPARQIGWLDMALGAIFNTIGVYIAFVVAHLLGRFYWQYKEKLNWEV